MGPKQVLTFWIRVKLGVIVIRCNPHISEYQNWSLTIRCNLMSETENSSQAQHICIR